MTTGKTHHLPQPSPSSVVPLDPIKPNIPGNPSGNAVLPHQDTGDFMSPANSGFDDGQSFSDNNNYTTDAEIQQVITIIKNFDPENKPKKKQDFIGQLPIHEVTTSKPADSSALTGNASKYSTNHSMNTVNHVAIDINDELTDNDTDDGNEKDINEEFFENWESFISPFDEHMSQVISKLNDQDKTNSLQPAMIELTKNINPTEYKNFLRTNDLKKIQKKSKDTSSIINLLRTLTKLNKPEYAALTQILNRITSNHNSFEKHHIPSISNKQNISNDIASTEFLIKELINPNKLNKIPITPNTKSDIIQLLTHQLTSLQALHYDQENYESPFERNKIAEESKLYSDAAAEIFKSLVENAKEIKEYDSVKQSALENDAAEIMKLFQARSKAAGSDDRHKDCS